MNKPMQTVGLKLIVERLSKCSDDFLDQYDKFMLGIINFYDALGVLIGTAEVENIKNKR